MLIWGDGDNDRLRLTAGITTTAQRVGKPTDTSDCNVLSFQFAVTDGNNVFPGVVIADDGTLTTVAGAAGGVQGTWQVYASNSYADQHNQFLGATWNVGSWQNVTATYPVAAVTGTGQNLLVAFVDWPYRHIMFAFTPSSATGALQRAYVFGVGKSNGNG